MPFKSKAQQRKMFELEKQGKVPKGTAEQWAKETPNIGKLPERVTAPKTPRSTDDLRKIHDKKFGKK